MFISSRTPEGTPHRCPVCGADVRIEPSRPGNDAPCPQCGALLWFKPDAPSTAPDFDSVLLCSTSRRPPGVLAQFLIGMAVIIGMAVAFSAIMAACFWYFGLTGGLFGLGPTELFIIMFLGILLFGRRLPEMGRYFGRRIVE